MHGGPEKAVYAYDLSGYAHWRRELARGFPFGQFGENLTVEGMPETEVRIDDVYRVGGALLQVTQPRSPCYKLAMRMERPTFPQGLSRRAAARASTSACSRRASSARGSDRARVSRASPAPSRVETIGPR